MKRHITKLREIDEQDHNFVSTSEEILYILETRCYICVALKKHKEDNSSLFMVDLSEREFPLVDWCLPPVFDEDPKDKNLYRRR